jgi:phage gp29-like protein
VLTGGLIDPTDERVLPREKFAIATFRPKDNDPRGTSDLRPAYNPWWLKLQTWQEFLKYLAQFASPSIVGTAAPGATVEIDPATGTRIGPIEALLEKLIAFHNGTALALPHGAMAELLYSSGEGQAFLSAFSLYNAEITKAITTQTLASNEAEFGTRAQASVHQDALGTIVRQAKRSLCRTLRRDVLRNTVRYNYGDKLAALTPKVSLGEVEAEDEARLITAFAQLQSSSYLHPSQYAGIDRRLNLPPRVLDEAEPPAREPEGSAV